MQLIRSLCRTPAIVFSLAVPWVLGLIWQAGGANVAGAQQSSIQIQRHKSPSDDGPHGGFVVRGFDRQMAAQISARTPEERGRLLQVLVAGQTTPLMGQVKWEQQQLIFSPRFALLPGIKYQVRFGLDELAADVSRPRIEEFQLTDTTPRTRARLVEVFPTSDALPQNILKMYLQFSHPMSRGEAYRRIRFFDAQGQPIADPFIHLDYELWSRDGRRFTLLFDPGRIKRGLQPHRDQGPPFLPNQTYQLRVDAAWPDAQGNALAEGYQKSFRMTEPDRIQPQLSLWRVETPIADSQQAVRVIFEEPLDRAMLEHAIAVIDPLGQTVVPTAIEIDRGETRWSFVPQLAWKPGKYLLRVDPKLEDLAGNSVAQPFETALPGESAGGDRQTGAGRRKSGSITELSFRIDPN